MLLFAILLAHVGMAQVSQVKFVTSTPGLGTTTGTVTIATPILNLGTVTATNVQVTSATLKGVASTSSFPSFAGNYRSGAERLVPGRLQFGGTLSEYEIPRDDPWYLPSGRGDRRIFAQSLRNRSADQSWLEHRQQRKHHSDIRYRSALTRTRIPTWAMRSTSRVHRCRQVLSTRVLQHRRSRA